MALMAERKRVQDIRNIRTVYWFPKIYCKLIWLFGLSLSEELHSPKAGTHDTVESRETTM